MTVHTNGCAVQVGTLRLKATHPLTLADMLWALGKAVDATLPTRSKFPKSSDDFVDLDRLAAVDTYWCNDQAVVVLEDSFGQQTALVGAKESDLRKAARAVLEVMLTDEKYERLRGHVDLGYYWFESPFEGDEAEVDDCFAEYKIRLESRQKHKEEEE